MKKIIFGLLLFVASVASADIGVVVKSTGVVISKEVYVGDTSQLSNQQASRILLDPSITFTNFSLPSATFDATNVPPNHAALEAVAITLASDPGPDPKLIRAVLLVLLDEVNTIRTNAALGLAPRTAAQLKTAITAKLNSGAAD